MLILVVLPLYLFFNSAPSLRCGGQTELHAVLKVWSLKVLFPNYTAGLVLSTWWCAAFHWFFFFFVCCYSLRWRFQSCQLWFKSFCWATVASSELSNLLTPVLIDCFSLKVKLLCHLFSHWLSFIMCFGVHHCQDSISLSQKAYHHLQLWKQLVLIAQIKKKDCSTVCTVTGC